MGEHGQARFDFESRHSAGQINNVVVNIKDIVLKPKSCVKLLGINIDHKLNFSEHVKTICKSASGKIKALFRIRPYLDLHKRRP